MPERFFGEVRSKVNVTCGTRRHGRGTYSESTTGVSGRLTDYPVIQELSPYYKIELSLGHRTIGPRYLQSGLTPLEHEYKLL
ncbi:predicted protein [Histoplasma mississippiense (nom. inval.)]|uniref:predicted protein n=1 Tax=Ajellomyces capsulatus (strain NAm1 / WU24) TaxID=2059318 RepID=UPI000157C3AD|nr:predicted protein [Histoplasma mississippiense (nom. inval.)]EDN07481.1 predicted protein [Histoplasma mississippiense (nom. inval.)]